MRVFDQGSLGSSVAHGFTSEQMRCEMDRVLLYNRQLKEKSQMLETMQVLKNFDADSIGLDELVALAAAAPTLQKTYEENALPVPDWLKESTRLVKRELKDRKRDFQARELKLLQAKIESKKTEGLSLADLEKRAAELQTALDVDA